MVVVGATRALGPPKVLLDCKGEHVYSPKVILTRFFLALCGGFGGGKDLIDEVRE